MYSILWNIFLFFCFFVLIEPILNQEPILNRGIWTYIKCEWRGRIPYFSSMSVLEDRNEAYSGLEEYREKRGKEEDKLVNFAKECPEDLFHFDHTKNGIDEFGGYKRYEKEREALMDTKQEMRMTNENTRLYIDGIQSTKRRRIEYQHSPFTLGSQLTKARENVESGLKELLSASNKMEDEIRRKAKTHLSSLKAEYESLQSRLESVQNHRDSMNEVNLNVLWKEEKPALTAIKQDLETQKEEEFKKEDPNPVEICELDDRIQRVRNRITQIENFNRHDKSLRNFLQTRKMLSPKYEMYIKECENLSIEESANAESNEESANAD